jgi:hypothetical protein
MKTVLILLSSSLFVSFGGFSFFVVLQTLWGFDRDCFLACMLCFGGGSLCSVLCVVLWELIEHRERIAEEKFFLK